MRRWLDRIIVEPADNRRTVADRWRTFSLSHTARYSVAHAVGATRIDAMLGIGLVLSVHRTRVSALATRAAAADERHARSSTHRVWEDGACGWRIGTFKRTQVSDGAGGHAP